LHGKCGGHEENHAQHTGQRTPEIRYRPGSEK
jgi:hypothetical protein